MLTSLDHHTHARCRIHFARRRPSIETQRQHAVGVDHEAEPTADVLKGRHDRHRPNDLRRRIFRTNGDRHARTEGLDLVRAQIELARQAAKAGPVDELRALLAKDPANRQVMFDLATALHASGDVEGAVSTLLDLFKLDREWNDGAARAQLFIIFEALKPQDPIVLAGRRRLSSMIFA